MTSKTAHIMAALFIAGTACGAPDVMPVATVEAACTVKGLDLATSRADVRADGVHFTIDNAANSEQLLYIDSGTDQSTRHLPLGPSTFIVMQPPGDWRLFCSHPSVYPGEDAEWAAVEVRDPDGQWIPHALPCDHPTSIHPDYEAFLEGKIPVGVKGDVQVVAQSDLRNWYPTEDGDTVTPVGYLEASPRVFAVERSGAIVAVADYRDDGRGGWFFGSVAWCEPDPGT
ncbi:MAG: hypothetical protein KJO18_04320 [Acidimicrobiia bacterium]|nr:hypothetical protein [Acidimicrobiia bacterium]